jgi:hypothetical protein
VHARIIRLYRLLFCFMDFVDFITAGLTVGSSVGLPVGRLAGLSVGMAVGIRLFIDFSDFFFMAAGLNVG